jgi:hypothetical protein
MATRPTLVATALAIGFVAFFSSAKADDDDMTTAQFVAQCSADPHSCQMSVGMGVVMGLSGSCVPDSMDAPSDAQILQVIDWLKAHPDVHPDDWAAADDAAIQALYPCAK